MAHRHGVHIPEMNYGGSLLFHPFRVVVKHIDREGTIFVQPYIRTMSRCTSN